MYIHLELSGYPEKTSKLTVPKGWVQKKPVLEVVKLFLETYNSKNPDFVLEPDETHLETTVEHGVKIHSDAIIGEVLEDTHDYFIVQGRYCKALIAKSTDTNTVSQGQRCRNYGCNMTFTDEENSDISCRHHVLPPYFHDTIKGWKCCKVLKQQYFSE